MVELWFKERVDGVWQDMRTEMVAGKTFREFLADATGQDVVVQFKSDGGKAGYIVGTDKLLRLHEEAGKRAFYTYEAATLLEKSSNSDILAEVMLDGALAAFGGTVSGHTFRPTDGYAVSD